MTTNDSSGDLTDRIRPAVLMLRIIVLAMIIGVLAFLGVAVFVILTGGMVPADPDFAFLTWVGAAGAVASAVASKVVPSMIVKNTRRAIAAGSAASFGSASPQAFLSELGDAGKLLGIYQSKTIVAAALLEGAAFFNLVAFMLTSIFLPRGVAVALALLIAALFPSPSGVANWIDEQLRLMADEKTLAE